MCKVTVFTTAYNVEKYLPRFFECMERQSFTDFKLLIIDDGSKDGTYEICKNQAKIDKRVEVIRIEHVGISAARNLVLPMIETPFAASADADDIYEDDYLLHLVDAQEKYDADLVISRVAYRNEAYKMVWQTPVMGERVIEKQGFPDMLPLLLEDERLNFLYGKLYRTYYLKGICVEDDVEMGSDTMINCQFVEKANRIVCIDDLDVNYIRYSSRSITSYKGRNMYRRMFRIQRYLTNFFQETDYMNDEMQRVIDRRIFQSVRLPFQNLLNSGTSIRDALNILHEMSREPLYIDAYERQKKRGNLEAYGFLILAPEEIMSVYVEKQLDRLEREKERTKKDLEAAIYSLEHSVSFRIGRVLTFPGRKLRDLAKHVILKKGLS